MNQSNTTYDLLKDSNLTQTIERGFAECHPLQFVRELLQNSIEAGATKVRVLYETEAKGVNGIDRAVFVDNGRGMADPNLMKQYAQFNSSGKTTGTMHDNFGIGAKISLLPFNQYGLVFMSWDKENPGGNMIWLCKNENNQYGAKRFLVPLYESDIDDEPYDYNYESCIRPDECNEEGIDWNQILRNCKTLMKDSEHGTAVILLGNHPLDSTGHYTGYSRKDKGAFNKWNKFIQYRYAKIYLNLQFIPHPQESKKHGFLNQNHHKRAEGLIGSYTNHIERTFSTSFPDGRVYIYLRNERKGGSLTRRNLSESFTFGFLYKEEVYYPQYGLHFAGSWGVGASKEIASRLTILVDFNPAKKGRDGVIPSQSRSNLIWKSSECPTNEEEAHQQTFKYKMDQVRRYVRNNLPAELIELIRENTPKTDSIKAEDVIKQYGSLYEPKRLTRKRKESTSVLIKDQEGKLLMNLLDSEKVLNSEKTENPYSPSNTNPEKLKETIGEENINGHLLAKPKVIKRKRKLITPMVSWCDDIERFTDDSKRVQFASYSGGLNPILYLNSEWHILKDYEKHILKEYSRKQDEPAVKEIIKQQIETAALGIVLHIYGSRKFGYSTEPEEIEKAVTLGFLGGHQTLTTIRHALINKKGITKK